MWKTGYQMCHVTGLLRLPCLTSLWVKGGRDRYLTESSLVSSFTVRHPSIQNWGPVGNYVFWFSLFLVLGWLGDKQDPTHGHTSLNPLTNREKAPLNLSLTHPCLYTTPLSLFPHFYLSYPQRGLQNPNVESHCLLEKPVPSFSRAHSVASQVLICCTCQHLLWNPSQPLHACSRMLIPRTLLPLQQRDSF